MNHREVVTQPETTTVRLANGTVINDVVSFQMDINTALFLQEPEPGSKFERRESRAYATGCTINDIHGNTFYVYASMVVDIPGT